MKKALATLAIVAFAGAVQAQLADWTFENTGVATGTGTDFTYGPADTGTNAAGSAGSGHHASSATTWSFPAGNGSPRSFSSNNWAPGDYYQFTLSTVGDSGLKLDWDQAGSSTGPRDFRLAYSTDGTTFTDFGTYSVITSGFSTSAVNTAVHQSFDLSGVTALNNQAAVFFRLIDNSTVAINGTGSVGTGGSDRVDNFTVSLATAVPEPSVLGMIGLGTALVIGALKRRKNRT